MKLITSASNPRVKQLLKLVRSSRERHKTGLTVLDGVHLIEAFMKSGGKPELIAISETAADDQEIININNKLKNSLKLMVSDVLFRQLSPVETPTGIAAVVKTSRPARVQPESAGACVLLENIQDPGNLGSILRSAAAADVDEIYLSGGCADAWSPRALRAGMGAHFVLRICEGVDLPEFVSDYRGKIVVACGDAKHSVFETRLCGRTALVLGNEGAGVSLLLRKAAHFEVRIPMSGKVESLNVAAAAAVCLFERVRQAQEDSHR